MCVCVCVCVFISDLLKEIDTNSAEYKMKVSTLFIQYNMYTQGS